MNNQNTMCFQLWIAAIAILRKAAPIFYEYHTYSFNFLRIPVRKCTAHPGQFFQENQYLMPNYIIDLDK